MAKRTRVGIGAAIIILAAYRITAAGEKPDFNRPSIGLSATDLPALTPEDKKAGVRWPAAKGVIVHYTWKGGPADSAGLGRLNIITAFGGEKVDALDDLTKAVVAAGEKESTIAFFRPIQGKKNLIWKRQVAKLTPVKLGEIIAAQVERHVDEATGAVVLRHRDAPKVVNENSSCDLYIATPKGGKPQLAMRNTYVADDWLFIREYIFLVDGERFVITPPLGSVERDNKSTIWEWSTTVCDVGDETAPLYKAAKAVAVGKDAKLIYQGRQYRKDREITDEERARIGIMLAYIESNPKFGK